MNVTLNITDTISPALKAILGGLTASRISTVAARAGANTLREHFNDLEKTRPNKQGFPRQHFWSAVRRSVQNPRPDGVGSVVSVMSREFPQRLYGGTIRPGSGKKYLTIPVRSEAYGKKAREFSDLIFEVVEGMGPVLARKITYTEVATKTKKSDARKIEKTGGEVMYLLRRKVTQKPDPTVLPTEQEFRDAIMKALTSFITRIADRQSASSAESSAAPLTS